MLAVGQSRALSAVRGWAHSCCSGPLPTEIGRFETVSRWMVRDNALTGTLPTELGNWRLRDLYMEGNNFQVCVPPQARCVTHAFSAWASASASTIWQHEVALAPFPHLNRC